MWISVGDHCMYVWHTSYCASQDAVPTLSQILIHFSATCDGICSLFVFSFFTAETSATEDGSMAEDANAKTLLTTSILGTMRVFVVLLAGVLASKWPKHEPLLTAETRRCASRLCTLLFLPALVISSVGATLTPAALRDSWQLVVASSFTILASNFTAWAFARTLLGLEDRITYQPVQLAIAFQNPAAFPLLLVASLCEQDDIKSDTVGDAAECLTKATGMIFIYVVIWQVLFYVWGYNSLTHNDALEVELTGRSCSLSSSTAETAVPETTAALLEQRQCVVENSSRQIIARDGSGSMADGCRGGSAWKACRLRAWDIVASPNIIAIACGLVIAMVPPVQEMLFGNPQAILRPLGAAIQSRAGALRRGGNKNGDKGGGRERSAQPAALPSRRRYRASGVPPHRGSRCGVFPLLAGEGGQLRDGRDPPDAPGCAYRVRHALRIAGDCGAQPSQDDSHRWFSVSASGLAVRPCDVHR